MEGDVTADDRSVVLLGNGAHGIEELVGAIDAKIGRKGRSNKGGHWARGHGRDIAEASSDRLSAHKVDGRDSQSNMPTIDQLIDAGQESPTGEIDHGHIVAGTYDHQIGPAKGFACLENVFQQIRFAHGDDLV